MYRQPNNHIYKTVVVVWLTLSVASVILAAYTWIDLYRKLNATTEAVAIQDELDNVLRMLVDVETGQRGFTITGDEKYLEPMRLGETNIAPRFEHLAEMVKEDSLLLSRVVDLRASAELMVNHHRDIVKARKERGAPAAYAMVAAGDEKLLMDNIRTKVAEIRWIRSDFLTDSGATARSRLLRASMTSLIAGSLGVGAGAFALWLARVMLGHQQRERELIEAKLHAERSSQEKSAFLANMSHEIRTPMNAILGFSELLEADLREPRQRQYLKSIRTSAASLLQLINDILDMSKIEAGVLDLRLEPTDPREICDFLRTVFSEPASKKGVKLECKVAQDLPHALLMDRVRLRQVLVNLVGNAVKFTDQGSIEVRVQYEKENSSSHITLLIEVQDTGVGIPEDKLEGIFQPFVQSGAHREKEKVGTGLGLSIVKRLTEMMQGTVTAASVLGQGSAFSLRFPHIAISAKLAAGEKLESGETVDFNELRPSRLLVVDDNETNCQLVAGMFADSHHSLEFGGNGREAVAMAASIKPDLILLDIRMPEMDGREALAEIRKISGMELTPVIAVTASSLLTEEKQLKNQFNGYVRKPFSKQELFDELSQFLPPHTAAPSPASPPAASSGGPALPAELNVELRRLLDEVWPSIRDSVAVNECKDFAGTLKSLAEKWSCAPLADYAQTMLRHAEQYAVIELEEHVFEFPALVERLSEAGS